MDGVMHPSVEQAIGRDRIRKAFKRYENNPADEHDRGIVRAVNSDGSYEVLLDGDVQTARCSPYAKAMVGDRVIVVTTKDGENVLLGRLGGEIGGGGEVVMTVNDASNYVAGKVFAHAGTNDPVGALLCDGRAVSRTTYWELFDAIGTTYGAGDGSSTFNLPNIESRTIIGEGTGASGTEYALGATGGEEKHKQTLDELAPHDHGYTRSSNVSDWPSVIPMGGNSGNGSGTAIEMAGGGQPFNIMQPYIVMRYFITTGKGDPASGINPADYVVEWKDNDNGWFWRKWASGAAECWGSFSHNANISTQWGSVYESELFSQNYPFSFVGDVECNISPNPDDTTSAAILGLETARSLNPQTETPRYAFTHPGAAGTLGVVANISAKGKWKDSPASGGTETIAPTIAERFEGIESEIDLLKTNKVLWSGQHYMDETQTATLSEAISAQPNGIVLAWSYYDGNPRDFDWIYNTIPKWHAANQANNGVQCDGFGVDGHMAKYIYPTDTTLKGYSYNDTSFEKDGLTFENAKYVLRYVIGY